jgi:hypothetical protein
MYLIIKYINFVILNSYLIHNLVFSFVLLFRLFMLYAHLVMMIVCGEVSGRYIFGTLEKIKYGDG